MPRPKEFDRDEVLDRAMELFWRKGYEATSIGDLTDHLGIGRQSLYDTFGDKHALYVAALDHYGERYGTSVAGAVAADGPIRKVLRDAFGTVIEASLARPTRSCMLLAATAERCPDDTDVAQRFCGNTTAVERAFTERLERAKRAGELGKHLEPKRLGRYFASALYGIQIQGRAGVAKRVLEDIADVAISILD